MLRRLVLATLLAAAITAMGTATAQARTLSMGMCGTDVHRLLTDARRRPWHVRYGVAT